MKKYILSFLIFFFASLHGHAQLPTISSTRFGNLKLGLNVDNINEYIDQKIKIQKITGEDEYRWDTLAALYKGIPVKLIINQYYDFSDQKFVAELSGIYTEDKNVTTKSGIKAGWNKFNLVKKLDGSTLQIYPNPDLGKNVSVVILSDYDNFTEMVFYFRDNVLYAIECRKQEEHGC